MIKQNQSYKKIKTHEDFRDRALQTELQHVSDITIHDSEDIIGKALLAHSEDYEAKLGKNLFEMTDDEKCLFYTGQDEIVKKHLKNSYWEELDGFGPVVTQCILHPKWYPWVKENNSQCILHPKYYPWVVKDNKDGIVVEKNLSRRAKQREKWKEGKICPVCGELFIPRTMRMKYCNKITCHVKAHREGKKK